MDSKQQITHTAFEVLVGGACWQWWGIVNAALCKQQQQQRLHRILIVLSVCLAGSTAAAVMAIAAVGPCQQLYKGPLV